MTNKKVAIVTGATGGIGFAVAKRLGKDGFIVVINGIEDEKGAERVEELAAAGIDAEYYGFDVTKEELVTENITKIGEKYGKIDVLINNAGIFEYSPINSENWMDTWHKTMDTNLTSAALLCKLTIEQFLKNKGGRIINISSRAAFRGDTKDYLAYAASKGGLTSLARTVARSFGKDRITSFTIAPGFTRTAMAEPFIEAYGEEVLLKEISLPELTVPKDISPLAAFICSGAMDHATGTVIDVNAGSYMH